MTDERWSRVRELLHATLGKESPERAGFLERACPDEDLRREVRSLLAYHSETYLEVANDAPNLAGRSLSHYDVKEELSRGGMGVVYRAHDRQLDRDIALKVLSAGLTTDESRRRRFVREARAAAALRHEHIAVVHEIGDDQGLTFIAMELIEGEKLSSLLSRETLSVSRAARLGLDMAKGLEHAHAKGIIHRDLKPANVMVTPEGRAKLIDFGLAKLVELEHAADVTIAPQREPGGALDTEPGVLMGTFGYMSPEQQRGEVVDYRSDVFSFGAVLCEMVTGRRLFDSLESTSSLPTPAVDSSDGADGDLATIPHPMRQIVAKCLAPEPDERYSSASDLVAALASLATPRQRRWPLAVAAGVVAVGIFIAGVSTLVSNLRTSEGSTLMRPTQLTSTMGAEDYPAWSPDGDAIAFQSEQAGNLDVWVLRLSSGEMLNRTVDHPGEDRFPSWSPDSAYLAFWSDRDGRSYHVMPAFEGAPRRLAAGGARGVASWSKDGKYLTFVERQQQDVYFKTVDLNGEEVGRLPAPGDALDRFFPAWSPNRRFVAYADAPAYNSEAHPLLMMRIADREVFSLSDGSSRVRGASWASDGSAVYFVSNQHGSMDLWRQRVDARGPDGEPQQITSGMGIRNVDFSPDAKRAVYSQGRRVANLWKVPILDDGLATWSDATQLTFDQALVGFVTVTPDREELLFSSNRSGNQDLFRMPIASGVPKQLTIHPANDWSPTLSPDGQTIAFYSNRDGSRDIWTMPARGGAAVQFTRDANDNYHPDWSPNGKELAFVSTRTGSRELWIQPVAGHTARQLTIDPEIDQFPKWSPDGRWFAFCSKRNGIFQIFRISTSGGTPELLAEGSGIYPRWSFDGRRVYFTGMGERAGDLWVVEIDTGHVSQLTDLSGRPGSLNILCFATDDAHLYFSWNDDLGDLWIADIVQ